MLGGILRYKCIFNIEPPNADLVPRIEERFSKDSIKEFCVPSYKLEAKGNVRKISDLDGPLGPTGATGPAGNIYMLSPRLDTGLVVYKNSADSKNLWTVTSSKQLELDDADDNNPLVIAFDALERDRLTFKDELERAKTIKVYDKYADLEQTQFNILTYNKKTNPDVLDPSVGYGTKDELYCTVMEIDNLNLVYPNTISELSYPSELENNTLFLKFIFKIHRKNFINFKYRVYGDFIPPNPDPPYKSFVDIDELDTKILGIDTRDSRLPGLSPLPSYGNKFPKLSQDTVTYENDFIYYSVTINNKNNIFFKSFFGRRMIIKLSLVKLLFDARYSETALSSPFVPNDDPYARTQNQVYGGSSLEIFTPANTGFNLFPSIFVPLGFDMKFEASKFEIESNIFEVGYHDTTSNTIFSQRVPGFKNSNGDYMIDVPETGYPKDGY